jgi:YidC/Oxa1 family membrane protein insertase
VDLVPAETGGQPLPFSLLLDAATDTAAANGALYVVENNAPARIDASSSPAAITFAYEGADGLAVRKRFTLQPAGFEVSFLADVKRGGTVLNPRIVWGPGLGEEIARTAGSGGFFSGNYVYPAAGFVHLNGSVERFAGAKASSAGVQQGAFRYAGVTDHYFVASTLEAPGNQRVEFAHLPYTPAGEGQVARQFVSFTIGFDQAPGDVRFFVGPKQFDALSAVSPSSRRSSISHVVLAVMLRGALEWVHGFVGNHAGRHRPTPSSTQMAPPVTRARVSMEDAEVPQLKAIQDRYSHLKMTDPARGKMNER